MTDYPPTKGDDSTFGRWRYSGENPMCQCGHRFRWHERKSVGGERCYARINRNAYPLDSEDSIL